MCQTSDHRNPWLMYIRKRPFHYTHSRQVACSMCSPPKLINVGANSIPKANAIYKHAKNRARHKLPPDFAQKKFVQLLLAINSEKERQKTI